MSLAMTMKYDNEAPQTGVFKNDWITLWVINTVKYKKLATIISGRKVTKIAKI